MKILSWNVNGIRACFSKGALQECIKKHNPDVVFFQEIKASLHQVEEIQNSFSEYSCFWHSAQKAGYAGTSVWVKKKYTVSNVFTKMPFFEDVEGRIIGVEIEDFLYFGVYFPNGGKSEEAWKEKLWFYDQFIEYMESLFSSGEKVVFSGDINVAHKEIDLARPKENDGNIGFHPLEREAINRWTLKGWKDVWRENNKNVQNQYSWWTYRGGAREKNVGWRIDAFFMSEKNISLVQNIFYDVAQLGSDHCPVILEINE